MGSGLRDAIFVKAVNGSKLMIVGYLFVWKGHPCRRKAGGSTRLPASAARAFGPGGSERVVHVRLFHRAGTGANGVCVMLLNLEEIDFFVARE